MVFTGHQILTQFLQWPVDVGPVISPISYMEKPRNREIKEPALGYTTRKVGFKSMQCLHSPCSEPLYHRLLIFPMFFSEKAPSWLFSKARDAALCTECSQSLRGPSQGDLGTEVSLSSVHQTVRSGVLQPPRGRGPFFWFGLRCCMGEHNLTLMFTPPLTPWVPPLLSLPTPCSFSHFPRQEFDMMNNMKLYSLISIHYLHKSL